MRTLSHCSSTPPGNPSWPPWPPGSWSSRPLTGIIPGGLLTGLPVYVLNHLHPIFTKSCFQSDPLKARVRFFPLSNEPSAFSLRIQWNLASCSDWSCLPLLSFLVTNSALAILADLLFPEQDKPPFKRHLLHRQIHADHPAYSCNLFPAHPDLPGPPAFSPTVPVTMYISVTLSV